MISIRLGLPNHLRQQAIAIHYNAFAQKLGPFISRDEARRIMSILLRPEQLLTAYQNGRLIGLAGLQHGQRRIFSTSVCTYVEHLGLLRGLRASLFPVLEKRRYKPGELLMDSICIAPQARGSSAGTELLTHVLHFARLSGYETVRLDVVNTNPRARALYKRLGFTPYKTRQYPIPLGFMGFTAITEMHHHLKVIPPLQPEPLPPGQTQ